MRKYAGIGVASYDTHCLAFRNNNGRLERSKVIIRYDPEVDAVTSSLVAADTKFVYKNHVLILSHLRRLTPCLNWRLKNESKQS